MRNQPVCLSGDRVDGPAAETGATIELCHVALAVQTQTVSAELLSGCVVSQAGNFFFLFGTPAPSNINQSCFFLLCTLVNA